MAAEPNYRRTKPGNGHCVRSTNQASTNGAVGPSSQIPGLCAAADSTPEEKSKGRRVGIQATDSDYVKLAKQGGQKGLLWHDDLVDAKPDSSYKPCTWFADNPDGQDSGSKATTPEGVSTKGAAQPLEPPFGTDNCSAWERDSSGKDKMVNNATSGMQKLSLSQQEIDEANKFKKTSHEKKTAAPVSMSKLLSFGYAEEEKKSPNDDDASSMTSEQTSTIAPEDELE